MDGEQQIKKAYESILDQNFEQAIDWFEQAIAIEPNNADYHYKLSITYARSNKLSKAIEHAQTAVQLEMHNEVYRFHVQNLRAKDRIQQAEKYFTADKNQLYMAIHLLKEAILLDSLAWEAYLMLGLAYVELEQYHDAIQAIREVLKLNPDHEIAQKVLVEITLKLNQ